MVNASLSLSLLLLFLKYPAAVQFPAVAHDTEVNSVSGESAWMPSANTAGRARSHTPLIDDMVNASLEESS